MAEFITTHGDLLNSTCEALVNTVNCRGPNGPAQASMGKGLALSFKTRYPEIDAPYKQACLSGKMRVGTVQMLRVSDGKIVANFPTKDNWQESSQLPWIVSGLKDLAQRIVRHGITSIAIPPLGCHNGKLSWHDVEPLIREHLAPLPNLRVEIYAPRHA